MLTKQDTVELVAAAIAAIVVFAVMAVAHAQSPIEQSFWNSYNAASAPNYWAHIAAERRNTEALINESRAARGAPPCSMTVIGQWQGRPPC